MSITEQAGSATDSSDPFGSRLVRARLARGLSIEEVCERTNIRPAVVRALERGDIEPSGGPVYARGHLRSLAHVLDIEPEQLLADFDGVHSAAQPERVLARDTAARVPAHRGAPRKQQERREHPSRWPIVATVVLVAVIAAAVVALLLPDASTKRAPAPPPASHRASAPPSKAATLPAFQPLAFPVPPEGVTLRIVLTSKPSWVSVVDERGVSLINGVVVPSSNHLDLHGAGPLRATIGDASAVALSCNGHPLGSLGGVRQVVTLILTRGDPQCPAA